MISYAKDVPAVTKMLSLAVRVSGAPPLSENVMVPSTQRARNGDANLRARREGDARELYSGKEEPMPAMRLMVRMPPVSARVARGVLDWLPRRYDRPALALR